MAPRGHGGYADGERWHWARDEWTRVAQAKADEALVPANAAGKHNHDQFEEKFRKFAERVDAQEADAKRFAEAEVDYKRRLKDAEDQQVLLLTQLETLRQEVLEAQDAEAGMEKLRQEVLEAQDELRDRVYDLEARAVQEGPLTIPMTFAGARTVPFVSALSTAPGAGAGPAPAPPQQAPPPPAPAPPLPAPAVPAQHAQPAQDENLADGLILDSWMPEHRHFRQREPPWQSPPGPRRC